MRLPPEDQIRHLMCAPGEILSSAPPPVAFGRTFGLIEWLRYDTRLQHQHEAWLSTSQAEGWTLAAAPDFYHAAKNETPFLEGIVAALEDQWIITSTTLLFRPDKNGEVTHYARCKDVTPLVSRPLPIPPEVSSGVYLQSLLLNFDGLRLVQALFQTEDSQKTIIETLHKLFPQPIVLMRRDVVTRPSTGEGWISLTRHPQRDHLGHIHLGDVFGQYAGALRQEAKA